MALCLQGGAVFMRNGKNRFGNPVNLTNVLMWQEEMGCSCSTVKLKMTLRHAH